MCRLPWRLLLATAGGAGRGGARPRRAGRRRRRQDRAARWRTDTGPVDHHRVPRYRDCAAVVPVRRISARVEGSPFDVAWPCVPDRRSGTSNAPRLAAPRIRGLTPVGSHVALALPVL